MTARHPSAHMSELAAVEAIARGEVVKVRSPELVALQAQIAQVRVDEEFTARARHVLDRDRQLLERLE
ncbi:MAG TPA: hypothetical protein VG478_03260 [Acidimicrobiales bacterium]|nr:hypothetical protein [Acidimicrobiales bacterium]